ncbi:MAG: septum formation family protein [Demequinaceae bacterium]|nr:septum formation family protein [Demequinaceae bacterium]
MRTRAIIGLAVMAGLILAGCSTENVADLRPGDCFNLALTFETQEISRVPTVECSKEHTAEVFLVSDLVSTIPAYDEDTIFSQGIDKCLGAFEGYVGVDYFDPMAADLDVFVVYPLKDAWDQGERGVTCAIIPLDPDGKLTGSQKNAFAAD